MGFKVAMTVNGQGVEAEVEASETLLETLRSKLSLTGTKLGCDAGDCGACTVLIDGQPAVSCLTIAATCRGRSIETVEGLGTSERLHPLQQAFLEEGGVQCGFCTPGMLLAAKALLGQNPQPTEDEIRRALSGNLCRCTGYAKIITAVARAASVTSAAR